MTENIQKEHIPESVKLEIIAEGAKHGKLEWYYKSWVIVMAISIFGPLGLLPLWFRPRTKISIKICVSAVVILSTIWMTKTAIDFYQQMVAHYQELAEMLQ